MSLFDGSGGFPLAASQCGITPIMASEVEPYPIAVTTSRFPQMRHLGDISKINGAEIEPVEIITFGSPCQDLSVAGKQAGLKHEENGDSETTRSGLFMEAVRIIKEMRRATHGKYPKFAVWENVPGAFSSNKGEDFRTVLEELIKISEPTAPPLPTPDKGRWPYADCILGDGWSIAYRVFDAQYWGVPQRRRRIYLVADLTGQCAGKVLFEREGVQRYPAESGKPREEAPGYAQGSSGADDREGENNCLTPWDVQSRQIYTEDGPWMTLYAGQGGGRGYVAIPHTEPTYIIDNIGGQAEYGKASEVNGTLRSGAQGAIAYAVENHPADSRVNKDTNYIDVELEVAVRKYEVDHEALCECLRDHKAAANYSNKDIAEKLDLPLTMVEHWFRRDTYFAIPESEVWPKLKKLLGIKTDEFDQSIMTFEFKGGTYDTRNRIHVGDTAPTLTCGSGNALHLLQQNPVYSVENHPADSRVNIDESGKCQTLTSRMGTGGGNVPMVMEPKPFCKGSRGRFPGDAPTYKDADIANTLNVFDLGEARANELVVEAIPALTSSKASFFMRTEEELASTLVATDYKDPQMVCYCLQGNGIDRADTAGCNGKGWKEDTSYTLNTIDRPAVAFSINHQGGNTEQIIEEKAGTITAAVNSSGNNKLSVAYGLDRASFNQGKNALYNFSVLSDQQPTLTAKGPGAVCAKYIVRRLTPTECARLQGFPDTWGHPIHKDTLSDEEHSFWLDVRNTHATINGRAAKDYTKAQMLSWYNKLHTDSAEYKMWGNGIALPNALYVMQGIAAQLQNQAKDE